MDRKNRTQTACDVLTRPTRPADCSAGHSFHPIASGANAITTPRPNYFVHQITKATDLPAIAAAVIDAACPYADLATMKSSATLCISDARKCINVGRYENAIGRATRSLAYSLGVFDEVYQAASDAVTAAVKAPARQSR